MSLTQILIGIACIAGASCIAAYRKAGAQALQTTNTRFTVKSQPVYHTAYTALWCVLPALIGLALWFPSVEALIRHLEFSSLQNIAPKTPPDKLELLMNSIYGDDPLKQADYLKIREYSQELREREHLLRAIAILSIAALGACWAWTRIRPEFKARHRVEQILQIILSICAGIAILTTAGIVLSVFFESLRFFQMVSPAEFLFSTHWSPQTAIRSDQIAAKGAFGVIPLFVGTLLISTIAIAIAAPTGLFSAIYLAEYASSRTQAIVKPLLEILAGIPTVVYGFFAALVLAPWVRDLGAQFKLEVSSESALAAGLVMAVMIIPLISSLSNDVIITARKNLRDPSLALGATPSETMLKAILPAALPGIAGSILLAISRAIGETMIVVMAAGLAANLTLNPLESTTTVTVQIVTLLVGDQEFDSAKTLAAFALGLMLFIVTLCLNFCALKIVRRYRERYE